MLKNMYIENTLQCLTSMITLREFSLSCTTIWASGVDSQELVFHVDSIQVLRMIQSP